MAKQAIARKCGARGLRAIIEDIMLDTMFELPDDKTVTECIIDEDAVNGGIPKVVHGEGTGQTANGADTSCPA